MRPFAAVVGILVLAYVLRDIFHTVFHPRGTGSIGDWIARLTWRGFRLLSRVRRGLAPFAGPLAMLFILMAWTATLVLAWGLILWSMTPEGFLMPSQLIAGRRVGFVDAIYASFLSLVTLAGGDMTPAMPWLRLLIPVESVIGFGMFTAGISWVLSVYPVLNRRRSFANEAARLRVLEEEEGRDILACDPVYTAGVLHGLAAQLIVIRGDLLQFPITYYFHAVDLSHDLPSVLPYLIRLSRRSAELPNPELQCSGRLLDGAVREFLETVAPFLEQPTETGTAELVRHFQRDHMSIGR